MSTLKYTPGPLAWQKFGDDWCLTGQYGTRPIVLSVGGRPRQLRLRDAEHDLLIPFDPAHPDARLLAAAVELLEACKAAVEALREFPRLSTEQESARLLAMGAIEKAEGL